MRLDIVDIDHNGSGIGKLDGKVVFVPKSVVGDTVEVEIIKEHKKFNVGKIDKIIVPSKKRVKVMCPYYDICGGCQISGMDYEDQLLYKKNKVINIFKKYLNMDINPKIIPSNKEIKYRNKITYHHDSELGLVSLYNKVFKVDNCLLVNDRINDLYRYIKYEDLSNVKKITIKECDNGLILSIDGEMKIDRIKDLCLSIYMNDECVYNEADGYIRLKGISYKVSNKSFFQINTSNISNLYDQVVNFCDFKGTDEVIDLYCGVGSISLYISRYVKKVTGIEIIEDAIKDAKENAKLNGISNVEFKCGDVSKLFDETIKGNIIIVDPPRVGLDNHTIDVLNKVIVDKLVYVSCDPMTLVRDIKKLDNYVLKDIILVDMFPQTHHVESVVLLERK